MLSSSPSLLLSMLSPLSAGGDPAATGGDAARGFADLLNGLGVKAAGAVSGEEAGTPEQGKPAKSGEPAPLTKAKTLTVRSGRLALATGSEDAFAPAQPAAATVAAIESGKILPVALPEAADGGDEPAAAETLSDASDATAAAPLPVVPGAMPAPPAQPGAATPAPAAAAAPRRSAATVQHALTAKVNPAPAQPADKAKPEAQPTETRAVPAVAITVAAPVPSAPQVADAVDGKPAAPVRAKPARGADLVRIEAPQVSVPSPLATTPIHADPVSPAGNMPVLQTSAPAPSPTDIDAALDHLVAAREALMPAEAALAIDHAEFGEVSIKFEQSSDGRLSAELTAADPELKRAVTAAVAADRGAANTADGDNGRSAQQASQRGSTSGGSDAATGERGQSGTGAERDLPQRRAATRPQAHPAASDQRPGIFA